MMVQDIDHFYHVTFVVVVVVVVVAVFLRGALLQAGPFDRRMVVHRAHAQP